jgi:hypothetical protein
VARLSLHWPTITSLGALRLRIGLEDAPVTYDPVARSIQWEDVPV